jgi:hypothetical protein
MADSAEELRLRVSIRCIILFHFILFSHFAPTPLIFSQIFFVSTTHINHHTPDRLCYCVWIGLIRFNSWRVNWRLLFTMLIAYVGSLSMSQDSKRKTNYTLSIAA